ncbi:flagellar hook-associated protein FlgL [Photobacterium leiognathi]|uniref:Flagellar hook-associated protein 3 n=1 Tax=Photobacterium leiognathi TaxID=553611 RepID=A0ABX5GGZ6_PHOLE|nr:flagellar hook-associated protein FlgL [Photobacterium leiognathi]KJF87895.1 flagellar hook protein FlgL [Photobacterium leiognathi]PSV04360.1 flagellar hook-associated protein 3 [Photobacterium leiognathi subsp. mandapamensis]PSV83533.1 flagellar hook-associated protein 3 [Photobacterium leiognathi]
MRVSDTQFSQLMLTSLSKNNQGLGEVLAQMSTGQRLLKLSDNPIDSINLLNLERENSAINQYQDNINNVKTALSSQEVHLMAASDTLKDMRDTLLLASNGAISDADRESYANKLVSLRDALISSFNVQDEEGNYLFSGTQSDVPAITPQPAGGYIFEGNSDKRVVTVAKGVTMEANFASQEMLDLGGNNILNQIDAAITELQAPTANLNNTLQATLNTLDITHDNVLAAVTDIGGRHNNLDLMETSHGDNKLFVEAVTNDLEALDYGEASVRLNNYMAALQATQASYMKINDLSLFNRL